MQQGIEPQEEQSHPELHFEQNHSLAEQKLQRSKRQSQ
jgi:hypothetical protein